MSHTTGSRRAKSNWENLFCNQINTGTHMDAHTIPADCSDDRVLTRQTPNGLIYTFHGNGRGTRCMVYGSYTKGREDEDGIGERKYWGSFDFKNHEFSYGFPCFPL